jgi:hypothetical protein
MNSNNTELQQPAVEPVAPFEKSLIVKLGWSKHFIFCTNTFDREIISQINKMVGFKVVINVTLPNCCISC